MMPASPGSQHHPSASHLSLVFSRALGRVVVHVHGPLDADTAHQLRDRLVDVIDGQGNRQVVLDLREMTRIDAVGFSVLVGAQERIQSIAGELILSGPTRAMTRAFAAAGLDEVFVITPAWTHPAHGDTRTDSNRGRDVR